MHIDVMAYTNTAWFCLLATAFERGDKVSIPGSKVAGVIVDVGSARYIIVKKSGFKYTVSGEDKKYYSFIADVYDIIQLHLECKDMFNKILSTIKRTRDTFSDKEEMTLVASTGIGILNAIPMDTHKYEDMKLDLHSGMLTIQFTGVKWNCVQPRLGTDALQHLNTTQLLSGQNTGQRTAISRPAPAQGYSTGKW